MRRTGTLRLHGPALAIASGGSGHAAGEPAGPRRLLEKIGMPIDLHSPSESIRWLLRNTIRLVVVVAGTAVVGAEVATLALPGPGILVILLGLVILTTQFVWTERALDRITVTAAGATNTASTHRGGRIVLGLSGTAARHTFRHPPNIPLKDQT